MPWMIACEPAASSLPRERAHRLQMQCCALTSGLRHRVRRCEERVAALHGRVARRASTCQARWPQSRGARAFGKVLGWRQWVLVADRVLSGQADTQGTLQAVGVSVASSPFAQRRRVLVPSRLRRPVVSLHHTICKGARETRVSIRVARAGAGHHRVRLVAGWAQDV